MINKKKEVLWLIWRNSEGTTFKIGELEKRNDKYYFKYDIEGVEKAQKYDFELLPYLPKMEVEYFREELFRTFADRIPIRGKKSADDLLRQYGLDEYDEYELLKRTGGKTQGDTLEFIDPKEYENKE